MAGTGRSPSSRGRSPDGHGSGACPRDSVRHWLWCEGPGRRVARQNRRLASQSSSCRGEMRWFWQKTPMALRPDTMKSTGGFGLLSFLLILAFLSHSGFSLVCYSCLDPVSDCNINVTCPPNLDACLDAHSGHRTYRHCWAMQDCTFQFISSRLGEPEIQYRCCQQDNCNHKSKHKLTGAAATISGKLALLVTPLVAAMWNLYL
ncbi:CD59 glycoprotein [Perognathus longimembris pacificus]|uniref:CD59 glycoprotein n=1 Tax=Perognathus longimembris pacificus TaxID=214514 RepID=UPI002018F5E0|nr:CD59 glycoprotein [Perognathus longimembris pacificus]